MNENPLQDFLDDVAAGVSPEAAALAAGVTLDEIAGLAAANPDFDYKCRRAAVMAERNAVKCISESVGKKSWMAAIWWLERRHPEKYAKRDKLDLSVTKRNLNIDELRDEIAALMDDPEVRKALSDSSRTDLIPA